MIRSMPESVKSTPANDWPRELKEKMNVVHRIVRENITEQCGGGRKVDLEILIKDDEVYVYFSQ